ncbi:hypothetical protein GCM10010377_30180 [Streptomyces viridiviolaceus]|nr:hypothetical protein GCM10010377_30180 [Streptomyces viridiviolaceus]
MGTAAPASRTGPVSGAPTGAGTGGAGTAGACEGGGGGGGTCGRAGPPEPALRPPAGEGLTAGRPLRRLSMRLTARSGSHADAVPLSSEPEPNRCGASWAWRSAGLGRAVASICMQDSMSGRSSSGRPSRSGPSRSSMKTVSTGLAPWKGGWPVAAKTSIEPSENTSLAPVTLRESFACSGDM